LLLGYTVKDLILYGTTCLTYDSCSNNFCKLGFSQRYQPYGFVRRSTDFLPYLWIYGEYTKIYGFLLMTTYNQWIDHFIMAIKVATWLLMNPPLNLIFSLFNSYHLVIYPHHSLFTNQRSVSKRRYLH